MGARKAVVVGINKYNDPDIKELKGAENDAKEIFARLKKFGEFDIDSSKHLLLGKKATCENIRRAISELFWKKDKCDIALLYFSGHGFLDDYRNGFIAPWDHVYEEPLVCGIRMQELRSFFLANNNKTEALLILDCCHSGVTAEPQKGATELTDHFYNSLKDDPEFQGMGKFVLASSGGDDKSRETHDAHSIKVLEKQEDGLDYDDLEPHDHGRMTYYLLEGMDGKAVEDSYVTIGKLCEYVTTMVQAYKHDGNKDFKVYDCQWAGFGQGPASRTKLMKPSSKSQIDDFSAAVRIALSDIFEVVLPTNDAIPDFAPQQVVYPASILDAIQQADGALKLSPESTACKELVTEINAALKEFKPYLDVWKFRNRSKYLQRDYREEYQALELKLIAFSFEAMRNLDREQGTLVMDCLRLAVGIEVADFESELRRKPFTRKKGSLPPAAATAGGSSK